jgi:serine/threonine protein kinase
MAPELSRGVHDATPAADMFSFGVIAYELLSTKLPYSTPPIIEAVHGRPMAAIESLVAMARGTASDTVLRLVDRCLAVAPEERPSADDVECALAGRSSAPVLATNLVRR